MKEKLKYFWIIGIILLCAGCASQKSVVVQSKEEVKTILRDSLIIRDSVVITPIERIVDIVPQYDTLHLQTSLAKARTWVDTTTHTLKGEITNKEQTQNKNRTEIKYIHRTDSVVIEKPIPYEVKVEVPYIPTIYKYSLWFSIAIIAFVLGRLFLKIKRLYSLFFVFMESLLVRRIVISPYLLVFSPFEPLSPPLWTSVHPNKNMRLKRLI